MFAVIKTGGKQYKVAKDDIVVVEKLEGEAGASVALDSVLMLGDDKSVTTGAPFVEGASVAAEVVEQTRGDKVIVFKKQRRQNYRRKNGHRQDLTVLKVTDILTDGKKAAKAAPKKKAAPKAKDEDADAPKKAPAKKKAAPKAKEEE
ncbi:50S ribosomal protein L21 [Denitrobaculum tricleocarpae]|uniref:Large ribosomal subunit protein bL21 n=1 Tax=Denitrobaculum tricleocarpae TaxID=2591009 RepID=A0A545TQP9_9PROT|nr:50S ribosomal protein L21 [Denitrobaculum tricleocarpae]